MAAPWLRTEPSRIGLRQRTAAIPALSGSGRLQAGCRLSEPSSQPGAGTASRHPGIFPTFFLSGFECSIFLWKDQGRRDLVAETQHARHADEDYAHLASLGIGVAREGIPWRQVDRGGSYDFSGLDPFIEAMSRHKVLPICDLCHYGYPDDLDPFAPDFADRFAAYARAAALHVGTRVRGPCSSCIWFHIALSGAISNHWR